MGKVAKDHQLDENYFLAALEDGGTFSEDYRVVYGRPDVIPAKNDAEAADRSFARLISGSSVAPETGAELVSSLLRSYTDEWLGTGFDSEGKESPFARRLTKTKVAWVAVWGEEGRALRAPGIDWDNGIEHSPFSLARKLTIKSTGEPLKPAVSPFAPARIQPPPATPLPDTNEWVLYKLKERRGAKRRDDIPVTSTHPNMPEDVVVAANLRAAILFHAFMKAPWRYRLGKCRRCQAYFVLKVNPSKSPYARGMHCSECKNVASADASGKTKRAEREQKLLSLAAGVWSSWRPTPQFGERNDWVAKQVSDLLGERKAIQRNWVTRHEKEIMAMQRKNRENTNSRGNVIA
jgi:hypothetical protein